jgi:hypothetical protein
MAAPKAGTGQGHMMKSHFSPEEMKQHVETRIKTLHAKLNITPEQEAAWGEVAQAMRDNETTISGYIQERQENAKTLTAIDDLESYQKIAQAHADGLKKVTAACETLYNSMTDEQKKNADVVFGSFEGHGGAVGHGKMKKHAKSMHQGKTP